MRKCIFTQIRWLRRNYKSENQIHIKTILIQICFNKIDISFMSYTIGKHTTSWETLFSENFIKKKKIDVNIFLLLNECLKIIERRHFKLKQIQFKINNFPFEFLQPLIQNKIFVLLLNHQCVLLHFTNLKYWKGISINITSI